MHILPSDLEWQPQSKPQYSLEPEAHKQPLTASHEQKLELAVRTRPHNQPHVSTAAGSEAEFQAIDPPLDAHRHERLPAIPTLAPQSGGSRYLPLNRPTAPPNGAGIPSTAGQQGSRYVPLNRPPSPPNPPAFTAGVGIVHSHVVHPPPSNHHDLQARPSQFLALKNPFEPRHPSSPIIRNAVPSPQFKTAAVGPIHDVRHYPASSQRDRDVVVSVRDSASVGHHPHQFRMARQHQFNKGDQPVFHGSEPR